jgi:hypothetical protein
MGGGQKKEKKMKFRAGHFVLDTEAEGTKRIASVWPDKEGLYFRRDGNYFYVKGEKVKLVEERVAFWHFWKINHQVHNFKWLFREVFHREFSINLITKKKRIK